MNPNEPTDDQLVELLGTYADALYESSVVPAGNKPPTTGATSATNQKANTMDHNEHAAAFEVDLQPSDNQPGKGKALALVAGLLLVAAIGIGAVSVLGTDDSSELDLAQAEDTTSATNETSPANDTEAADAIIEGEEPMETEFASTSPAFTPFQNNSTVFANGDFVTLTNMGDGFVINQGIGDDTVTVPTTGLPADGHTSLLITTDSGFAALIEQFPEFSEEEEFGPFDPGPQPTYLLATSADLTSWTTAELPSLTDSADAGVYITSIAASGNQIAIAAQLNSFGGPEQVLLDAGLITEEDLFNVCSTEWTDTQFMLSTCDFEEGAEFDEDVAETLLITIDDTDPIFEEIEASMNAQDQGQALIAAGPATGPFEIIDGPVSGWDIAIAGTPDGFLIYGSGQDGTQQTFSSTNGLTWTETESPTEQNNAFPFVQLASNGNTIVAITQSQLGVEAATTTDLGQTWTQGAINSALFSPWGNVISGPAGFVAQLQGTTEPFDTGFPEDGIFLEKDGYSMSLDPFTGLASLVGPDGTAIHEDVVLFGAIENVVRFEGPSEEDLIWLDPATGDDLVTFSESDFEAAYPEVTAAQDNFEDEDFVEPDSATEIWFSADGTTWTLLETSSASFDAFSSVLAVGDDEVVTVSQAFVEPPAELTDFENEFEPTDEEIAALDAWYAEQGDDTTYTVIPIN